MTFNVVSDTIRFAIDAFCDIFMPIFLVFIFIPISNAIEISDTHNVCMELYDVCVCLQHNSPLNDDGFDWPLYERDRETTFDSFAHIMYV